MSGKITTEKNPIAMLFECNRLKTFTKWIYKNDTAVKCTPEKMAKAGFYITSENEPGTAQCFVCLKTLDGWERDDDPFEEHKNHAPYCPFVKLNKEENELTVSELVALCESIEVNITDQHLQNSMKKLEELHNKGVNALKKSEKKTKH